MDSSKRFEREQRAARTIQKDIPEILRATPRALYGVQQAEIITEPAAVRANPTSFTDSARTDLTIRLQPTDALQAAERLSGRPFASRRRPSAQVADGQPNVAVHCMGSLVRPGGGFVTGANGQEEFLCTRTTLYASLWNQIYPLPEVGGVYSPNVLVFRNTDGIDYSKRDRFFIDVITAGVPRHPDGRGRIEDREASCSCGVSYCDQDRDIMVAKMKAVMRMAQMKGHRALILGDWGCGPQKHPVKEVAKLWRKVIIGGARQRRPNAEQWEGIQEIIFAIPNSERAAEFRKVFDDVLAPDYPERSSSSSPYAELEVDEHMASLMAEAASLELQIDQARSSSLRHQLRDDLAAVMREMALGRAARHARDFSGSEDEEDMEDDYVVGGYPGSDGEDNSYYRVEPTTSDSDSDVPRSDACDYRFGASNGRAAAPDMTDAEDGFEGIDWRSYQPSPRMTQDGWFRGSIDELSAHLYGGIRPKEGSISPRSPLVRCDSGATDDAEMFDGLLARFQRTGMS